MLRTRKRWISLLVVLTFLLSLLPAGMGFAGTTYGTVTAIPEFNPGSINAQNLPLATVLATIDPSIPGSSSALLEVVDSSGSLLKMKAVTGAVYDETWNSAGTVNASPVPSTANPQKTVTLTVNITGAAGKKAYVKLDITVDAKDCAAGEVKVRFSNATGQLMNDAVIAAYAKGAQVELAALEKPAFGDAGTTAKIRIKETVAGGLKVKSGTLKFKLPVGFSWDHNAQVTVLAGNNQVDPNDFNYAYEDSDRTLKVNYTGPEGATPAIVVDLTADVKVDVSTAKLGDVTVAVSGESSVSPSEIVIGTYGEYKVTLSTVSVKTIQPGQFDQEIDKFAIEEALPGTLVADRTIVLTLPEEAKWYKDKYPTFSTDDSSNYGNFTINGFEPVGTDGRTIKAKITNASTGTKPTKLVFKGGKITVKADYVGDIVLTVSGSAGASGTVKVAEVKAPVTATASGKPEVIIGQQAQAAADVTLTESTAEAIKSQYDTVAGGVYDAYLYVETPPGVRFAAAPTFTVTEGDVQLGTVVTDSNWEWASVRVKSTSSKPSTIKVSNIKLIVDRTVPEGDIELKIGGSALVENDVEGYFPNAMWAAKVVVAKCVTPAPVETKGTAVFKIGEAKYTLNGTEVTMDVAPYIKDGRTFLPVRFAANAVGVSDANIIWDGVASKVTVIKGDRIVQMTIGSNVLLLNGAAITMDVAPEITAGRTMLPIRFLAQALGADIQWNAETQEVTINF